MSGSDTIKALATYVQSANPTRFLTGLLQMPAGNVHMQKKVELDIQRSDEEVATVITDLSTGYNYNSHDEFVNKEFTPPIYKEAFALNAFDMLKRSAGQNPFADNNFQAKAMKEAAKTFNLVQAKISRAVELQASQMFQTGTLNLLGKDGLPRFMLDFKPKATHFPNAAASWVGASDKINDIKVLAEVLRSDGLSDPSDLIFGDEAFQEFMDDDAVQKLLDNRAINIGEIDPQFNILGQGATLQGTIKIGNYRFRMWTYAGTYLDPATKVKTKYIDPENMVMLDSAARFDLTVGMIPKIVQPDARALPFMPPQVTSTEGRIALSTNAWTSADGEQVYVGAGARPLVIPTAIDRFGCLTAIF